MRKGQAAPLIVSVVLPTLNEESTVAICVKKAFKALKKAKIRGEVIVVDNGSTDNSAKVAKAAGAKVVSQPQKGYGNALMKGFKTSVGQYILMADADNTYDLAKINQLIKPLQQGYDLVIGSRFKGKMAPGSMPWSHRYIGNPILSALLRLFFGAKISDAHCGMRAFSRSAFKKMKLRTTGMEFASEMIIRAVKSNLKITEVPVGYHLRAGKSKLHSIPDAWRHLRFMLLYSPTYLFLIPGIILFSFGLVSLILVLPGPFFVLGHGFDIHFMIGASLLTITGFQIINVGMFAKVYAFTSGLEEESRSVEILLRFFNLEKGLFLSGLAFLVGFLTNAYIFLSWAESGFGTLDAIRPAILALTLMVIGLQGIFSSFFFSILGIKKL
jgi:glycosyltransferase involved in cell wall biosynthesis